MSLDKERTQSGSDGIQNSEFGHHAADKHFCVSKITSVRGKQAASDGTLPWFSLAPSPSAGRHKKSRRTEEKLKEERQRGASKRKERERDSTR